MYLSLQTHHLRHVLQHSVILINKIDAVCRRMPPQTAPWLTQMGSLYAQNAAHVLTAAPVGLQTLISIWERSLVRKQKKNVIRKENIRRMSMFAFMKPKPKPVPLTIHSEPIHTQTLPSTASP